MERERPGDERDPFRLPFDEDFVHGAAVREPSAAERERQAFVAREHQRLQEQAREERVADSSVARGSRRRRRINSFVAVAAIAAIALYIGLTPRSNGKYTLSFGPDFSGSSVVHIEGGVRRPASASSRNPSGCRQPRRPARARTSSCRPRRHSSAPVAYDPCRLIHVVLNDRTAPPGADARGAGRAGAGQPDQRHPVRDRRPDHRGTVRQASVVPAQALPGSLGSGADRVVRPRGDAAAGGPGRRASAGARA